MRARNKLIPLYPPRRTARTNKSILQQRSRGKRLRASCALCGCGAFTRPPGACKIISPGTFIPDLLLAVSRLPYTRDREGGERQSLRAHSGRLSWTSFGREYVVHASNTRFSGEHFLRWLKTLLHDCLYFYTLTFCASKFPVREHKRARARNRTQTIGNASITILCTDHYCIRYPITNY